MHVRRTILCALGFCLLAVALWAHNGKDGKPLSPPGTATVTLKGQAITIAYSRPSMRGRQIFGGLVPYDKLWRTGANAATTLTTPIPLRIGDAQVPAGKYSLFTIPAEQGGWTLVINKQTGQSGLKYNQALDLARTHMQPSRLEQPLEQFTISFDKKNGTTATLHLDWERTRASIPIQAQ